MTALDELTSWRVAAVEGKLPDAVRADRWQPLRAGLVNLWEYDKAEVWYADGRMQLQGANESGKSTLLTLTTLLLLAGDTSAHNIDTLGQDGKRFRYYVEPTDHPLDRRDTSAQKNRGWAWLEFGKGTEFFTLLLFAEARRADGNLKVTWCTVGGTGGGTVGDTARVRLGLELAPSGFVADPAQFKAVGGFVAHPSGTAYRETVARALFGAEEPWLQQLNRILRVVRTPQIGSRIDLKFLTGNSFRVSLTAAEREEVGRLLGFSWTHSSRAVGARALAETIGNLGTDVPELLAALGTPVRDLRGARIAARQGADDERERAVAALADAGVPADVASAWAARRGLPAAGSGQLAGLASRCARVWECVPGPNGGRILLTVLAAAALDDPHALDRGSPVATGVLRLLGHELPESAETWRAAWEEHGVDCDPVSSRVLVLNLPLDGDAPCVPLTHAADAEPLWLTLRSLVGTFRVGARDVYVCENPSVLIAAADGLGSRSRPLICTNGRPSAAAVRLLTRLAETGTTLHVRADDDPAGQEIVKALRASLPNTRLWRYTQRPPATPRYEEQDLAALLADLDSQERLSSSHIWTGGSSRPGSQILVSPFPAMLRADGGPWRCRPAPATARRMSAGRDVNRSIRRTDNHFQQKQNQKTLVALCSSVLSRRWPAPKTFEIVRLADMVRTVNTKAIETCENCCEGICVP